MKKLLVLLFSVITVTCFAQPTFILQPGYRDFFNKIKIDSACISCSSGDFSSYVFQVNSSPIALAFEEDNDMIWNNLFYKPPASYSGTANLYLRLNPTTSQLTWNKLKKVDFDDLTSGQFVFGALDASGGIQQSSFFSTDGSNMEISTANLIFSNPLSSFDWSIGSDDNGSFTITSDPVPIQFEDNFIIKEQPDAYQFANNKFGLSISTDEIYFGDFGGSQYTSFSAVNGAMTKHSGSIPATGEIFMGNGTNALFGTLSGAGGITIDASTPGTIVIDGGAFGTGTVTSVDFSVTNSSGVGATTSVTGNPITGAGTITLNIPDAGIAVQRGLVTNATQTFEGDKTFNNTADFNDDATFLDLAWFGTNRTKIDANGRIYLYNNVTPAAGMLLKGDGTDFKTFSIGSSGQVLSVNSGGTDVEWGDVETLIDINSLSAETTIDVDDDKLIMYDASETANNSVTIEELLNEYLTTYRKHTFDYHNEFLNGVGTATGGGDVISVSTGSGASSTGTASVSATNVVGLLTSTTGTTATGRTAVVSYASAIALGGGAVAYEYRIDGLSALSTVTERYQLVVGFLDTYSAANQVDGVYFLYDEGGVSTGSAASANWQTVTVSNSNRTFNTTGTAVSTSGHILRIEINAAGTSVEFFIDGTSTGVLHTTNIPTGTARAVGFGMLLIKSIGTTARSMNSDYIAVQLKYTTPKN